MKNKEVWLVEWTRVAMFDNRTDAMMFWGGDKSQEQIDRYKPKTIANKDSAFRQVKYVNVITENCQYPQVISIKELDECE